MYKWWENPLDVRATKGGERGVDGIIRHGGEFLPFYIPRPEMPQVDEKDYSELLKFIQSHRAGPESKVLSPQKLHAHQRVDWGRVRNMPPNVLRKPILISSDLYVLDGNHRWHACVLAHLDVHAIQIEREFESAISLLFEFPKTYCYGDGLHNKISN